MPWRENADGTGAAAPVPSTRARESGAVTAEAAMVLPTLVALTLALVWLLSLAVVQTRVVDAARESARALARSEEPARAVELGARIAPADAHITTSESGGTVTVQVTAPVRGPGGLLAFLPDFEVDARAVAAKEEASW